MLNLHGIVVHRPSGSVQSHIGMVLKYIDDIQAVGYDCQNHVGIKRFCEFRSGGSVGDEYDIVWLHQCSGCLSDCLLLSPVLLGSGIVQVVVRAGPGVRCQLIDIAAGKLYPAVEMSDLLFVFQRLEIAAEGGIGAIRQLSQFGGTDHLFSLNNV